MVSAWRAIQLAKLAGATVIATAPTAAKLERLQSFGMDHGIDYLTQEFVAATQKIVAKAGLEGVDVVVDSVGGPHARRQHRRAGLARPVGQRGHRGPR